MYSASNVCKMTLGLKTSKDYGHQNMNKAS